MPFFTNRNLKEMLFGTLCCTVVCCFTQEVEAQTASIQLVNASDDVALSTADVYLNGELAFNNVAAHAATPFFAVESNTPVSIAVAPGNSTSAADALLTLNKNFDGQTAHSLAFYGISGSAQYPLGVMEDNAALTLSDNPTQVQISLCHLATDAPAFDLVLRNSGQMIAGNLGFTAQTPYLSFAEGDHYIDIKQTGTSSIFSTVRLSLQGFAGQAARVFMTGNTSTPTSLQLFVVYPDGLSLPLDYAPLGRVQFVNALVDTVDVFKNGTRFADNALPQGATPFKNIPAGLPMNIGLTAFSNSSVNIPQAPYGTFEFQFENMQTYLAVGAGRRNDSAHPLNLFFTQGVREKALNSDEVDLRFFNAAYNHPELQLIVIGEATMANATYGAASEYQSVVPGTYQALLANASGAPVSDVFSLHLDTLAGQVLHLVAAYNKAGNPQVWGVTAAGATTNLFGATTSTTTASAAQWQWTLGPNPTTDHIVLSATPAQDGRAQVVVFNQQGKIVHQESLAASAQTALVTVIQTNSWPTGLYCLAVRSESSPMFFTKFSVTR